MIPQEADQTHIEYGFPVEEHEPSSEVDRDFPVVFPWFLLAMKQWLSSELAHVRDRNRAVRHLVSELLWI